MSDDARVVHAHERMTAAYQAIDKIVKAHAHRGVDCEEMPDFLTHNRRWWRAIKDLIQIPACSSEGMTAKARALLDQELYLMLDTHGDLAVSLAKDLLRYYGAPGVSTPRGASAGKSQLSLVTTEPSENGAKNNSV